MRHLQTRLLQRAIEIFGSAERLASTLEVEEHTVMLWLRGANAPERVYNKLLDVVLQDDVARAAQDRRHQPRVEGGSTSGESAPEPSAARADPPASSKTHQDQH